MGTQLPCQALPKDNTLYIPLHALLEDAPPTVVTSRWLLSLWHPRRTLDPYRQLLTGQRIHPNGGTHVLELHSELRILSDLLLVLAGKFLQVGLEHVQLLRHL